MGADIFVTDAYSGTAEQAFEKAVEQACYDHGHSGYTGTVGEKGEFVEIPLPDDIDDFWGALEWAENLASEGDERVDDKWGPAGAIEVTHLMAERQVVRKGERWWVFFGWASA